MTRTLVSIWLAFIAAPLLAQRPPSRIPTSSGFLSAQIDRMESDIRNKSAALRRDAFIVSQVTSAVGELDDFQRTVAVDKARDHIEAAFKRAGENPVAPRSTFDFLSTQRDLIAKIQAGNSWELSAVPYIPAVENAAQHAANLRKAGGRTVQLEARVLRGSG